MTPILDRSIDELNPVELSILRLSTFELLKCLDIPYKVIINEALELTKSFGSNEGFKYVNGILDKIAKKLRKHEILG
jgi:N utilization substance protein B